MGDRLATAMTMPDRGVPTRLDAATFAVKPGCSRTHRTHST